MVADTYIYMKNVIGEPEMRELTQPLPCINKDGIVEFIPIGFRWDGSSTPFLLRGLFPKHRHPIASCRHDFRCGKNKNKEERKWSDQQFKLDVRKTSWRITAWMGYAGVRIGAFLGIGNSF